MAEKLKAAGTYDHVLDERASLALQILQQAKPEELKSGQTEQLRGKSCIRPTETSQRKRPLSIFKADG